MPTSKGNYTQDEINQWDESEVAKWLITNKLEYLVEEFKSNQIDGQRLLLLSWDEFKTLDCLREEKRKKAFKKALSSLPGASFSSSKQKATKKFGLGGAKKGKQQQQQPVSYSPPLSPNYPGNAPVLPPRPSKPGHQDPTPPPNYPAPSQPPKTRYSQPPPPHLHSQPPLPSQPNLPARNIPPPSILSRPPIQHIGGYPPQGDMGGGYDEEAEDIYDAVPEETFSENQPPPPPLTGYDQQFEDEDIYDLDQQQDSFDEDNEDDYDTQANMLQIQQQPLDPNNQQFLTLQAQFRAHGIGSPPPEDEFGEEIYDIPEDMRGDGQGDVPPPPPPDDPPEWDEDEENFYDESPDPPPPSAPPTGNGGYGYGDGYGDDEEIYDTADPEDLVSQQQPTVNNMEDFGDEEIYDTMDAADEFEEDPPVHPLPPKPSPIGPSSSFLPPKPPSMGTSPSQSVGMRPMMRPPIQANRPLSSNTSDVPPLPPSINGPPLMRASLHNNVPPPPMPSRSTKPQTLSQQQNSGQGPPPPPVPPPVMPPSTNNQTKDRDSDDNISNSSSTANDAGGNLASQLANMKNRLRSGSGNTSGSSPSSSPSLPTKKFPSNQTTQSQIKSSESPGGGGGDLASSIMQARMHLRGGNSPKLPSKGGDNKGPVLQPPGVLKPSDLKNRGGKPKPEPEPPIKSTIGALSNSKEEISKPSFGSKPFTAKKTAFGEKPVPGNKPTIGNKPPIGNKPAFKPRGNKISNIMNAFQNEQEQPKLEAAQRKPVALDRSPMSGHKMVRNSSVKELTDKYNSPPPEEVLEVVTPATTKPPPVLPPRETISPANVFTRRNVDELSKDQPPLPPKPKQEVSRSSSGNSSVSSRDSPEPRPPSSPVARLPSRFNRINIPEQSQQPNFLPKPVVAGSKNVDNFVPHLPAKPRTSPDPIDKPPELPGREIPPKLPGKPDLPGRGPLELPGKPDLSGRGGRPELPGRGPPELPGREGPPELPGRPNLPMRGGLPELPGRPDLPERGGPPELPGRPSLPGRNVPDRNATNPPTSYSDPSQPPEFPKLPQRPHHDLNDISSQSWYHKGITREQATVKIKRYHKDGTFVVRDNTKNPGEYSLSLWHGGGIRHLKIRKRNDGKFVLGEEKIDEVPFDAVTALVEHHKAEPLVLKSGGETILKYECPH